MTFVPHRLAPLFRSLRVKILLWLFVPTAIILAAVAVQNFYAYQDVTEDLVIDKNADLVRLSASQVATELAVFSDLLTDVARTPSIHGDDPASQTRALQDARGRLVVFDAGVFLLSNSGVITATQPYRQELIGQDWSQRSFFRRVLRFPQPHLTDVVRGPGREEETVAVAVPITDENGLFRGSLVGMFGLQDSAASALYASIVRLRIKKDGDAFLVDSNGRVIYHSNSNQIGSDFSGQEIVRQVLAGSTESRRTSSFSGEDIVAGFSPVPGTTWSLVTEEAWSGLISESQSARNYLLILLALGIVIPILFVIVGLRRIMRPVDNLIRAARQIAGGNFSQSIPVTSSDEIGMLGREFNLMASQLHESYEKLEERVAQRTEEVKESEERFRSLFEESQDAIFISRDGNVIAANQAALKLFGFSVEDAIGSVVGDRFADPDDGDRFRDLMAQTGFVNGFEVQLLKKDGTLMDCLLTASLRPSDEGVREIQGIVRDITNQKRAQEMVVGQERDLAILEERNRMAREIHDTLAQGFTGIVIQMEAAEQAAEKSPSEMADHLQSAKALARDSLQEARRSVWNLPPQSLESKNLEAAIKEEILRLPSKGQKIHFSQSG